MRVEVIGTLLFAVLATALMLLVGTVSVTAATATTTAAAAGGSLVLSHSLTSLFNEVPGVWTASIEVPSSGGDSATRMVELGELRLERQSDSASTLYLPAAVVASGGAGGPERRLAFDAISCEEYKHSKGKCFLFLSDNNDKDGEEEEIGEMFVDYVVRRKERRGASKKAAAAAVDEDEDDLVGRRGRRRGAKKAVEGSEQQQEEKEKSEAKVDDDNSAPLVLLHTVSSKPKKAGSSADGETSLGRVTVEEESIARPSNSGKGKTAAVDRDVDSVTSAPGEAKAYALSLRFHLHKESSSNSGGAVFPVALHLRGVTGDVQTTLAAAHKQEKLRQASGFFAVWLYPLCYLAGLYGVLWAGKAAMDRKTAQQKQAAAAVAGDAGAAAPAVQ